MGNVFERGDLVEKVDGYRFPGVVVGVIQKLDGSIRYNVEADHPDFVGMLHIFSGAQLRLRTISKHDDSLPPLPTDVAYGQQWRHAYGALYTVLSVSYDEVSLRPLVTYYGHGAPWTRHYDVFKQRFTRVM